MVGKCVWSQGQSNSKLWLIWVPGYLIIGLYIIFLFPQGTLDRIDSYTCHMLKPQQLTQNLHYDHHVYSIYALSKWIYIRNNLPIICVSSTLYKNRIINMILSNDFQFINGLTHISILRIDYSAIFIVIFKSYTAFKNQHIPKCL